MNLKLSKKIKELRTKLGFSQEELATKSNLSLRTVQRIEGGETDPRGDTLKRLAQVLEVKPNDLVDWVENDDKTLIIFLNLSALSILVFPLLGVIIPLTIWVLKRHNVKNWEEIGKKIINFQITWCLVIGLYYISFIILIIFHIDLRIPSFGRSVFSGFGSTEILIIGFLALCYGYNICLVLINTFLIYKGRNSYYKPAYKFFK